MSAHRWNYRPEPIEAPSVGPEQPGLPALVALIGLALAIGLLCALVLYTGAPPAAVATPVRTPDVQIYPLEPLDAPRLADLRIEAFRAGYRSALHDGCRLPALATPIAEARP